MPSTLAAQLAKNVSLNAPLLSETARKKHFASSSYLFSSSTKSQIDDLDTIHALAINALSQLRCVYPSLGAFNDYAQVYRCLFSQKAKETDRTLLGRDELNDVNEALRECLRALGCCLLEGTAGRVLEWLVRRFRINEFNVSDVLALFLPYHESPHFAKMISILIIDENAPWRFLSAYKVSGKAPSRSVLVTEMLKERELARYVVGLLPEALTTSGGINAHRTLICFNTAVLLEYVTRVDKRDLDAAALAFVLPALMEPLKVANSIVTQTLLKDGILGSYVLLSALSHKCMFNASALNAAVSSMVHSAFTSSVIEAAQLVTALVSFLGAQETLDKFQANIIDEFIALPDILKSLRSSMEWTGFQKVIIPILGRLTEMHSEEPHAAVLQFLLTADHMPEVIPKTITKLLLKTEDGDDILAAMHQRYPKLLRIAADELVAEGGERLDLDQRLLGLAMPEGSGKAPRDVILASSNADPSVRASAVRNIIKLIAEETQEISSAEQPALHDALCARVYDTSAAVLEALYATPAQIITILSAPNALAELAASLTAQTLPRAVLRAHLSFFCNSFYSAQPTLGMQVLLGLVFPHVFFSKPRGKTASSVWDVVCASALGSHMLLRGTKEIINATNSSLGVEEMAKTNTALAKQLAENIITSNEYSTLFAWLLEGVADEDDVHRRLFALTVTRALLVILTGEDKIVAAYKVLKVIRVVEAGDLGKQGEDDSEFNEVVFEEAAARSAVLKPSSRSATQRLQLSILTFIPSIRRLATDQVDWFSPNEKKGEATPSLQYLHMLRVTYALINSTTSNISIIAYVNRALFENLGYYSLLFLAGVWASFSASDACIYVALRHASAFLRAQSIQKHIDFQAVLPALLDALQSPDRQVRAAAMDCVSIISEAPTESKPAVVYAFDQVYGSASAALEYLDWFDEAKYLRILAEHRDHLVNDAEYLINLHYEYLSSSIAEKKKGKKAVQRVSDFSKLQMLLPVIEEQLDTGVTSKEASELLVYALESFDISAAKDLNADESRSWPILLRALQFYHDMGEVTPQWTCICAKLRDRLFASLSNKRQLELSMKLIVLGSTMDETFGIKRLLGHCIKQSALIKALLQSVQPAARESEERASKRAKTDMRDSESSSILDCLTFLAEVLASQALPGSLEVVSGLLETLNRLLAISAPAQADMIYVEQLLMACVESAASQIKELPNLAPSAIRLDVLVELMRTSENPQTFHQALLLMASLARLSPESVLHNVMPIFTFMGSNVFHRDDSYSFKVIQKTTESIVPVATASLKQKHTDTLDLFIASRELIRTFTDAFTHIPRHRRTSFFTHLIDVLNPADFLAPVLMLLADKMSNRVPRQSHQEAESSLVLPQSILQHYSAPVKFAAMKDIVREVERLVKLLRAPTSSEKVFLETMFIDDQSVPTTTLRKRQSQTLLTFIGLGMKHMAATRLEEEPSKDMRDIITCLLELAAVNDEDQTSQDLQDIGIYAQQALLQSMTIISTAYFASIILSMLSNGNTKIRLGALELLAARVPEMKTEAREAISPIMAQIIDHMNKTLASTHDPSITIGSIKALLSIGSSSCPKEESSLTNVVPVIVDIVDKYPEIHQTMTVISVLIMRLGPRIIPHLRSLISSCVSSLKGAGKRQDREMVIEGLHALSSRQFFSEGSSQFEKLVKLLAKQIPSKTLISSLFQCWPLSEDLSKSNGYGRFGRFFDLLKRCLHFSARADILENIRSLFNHFLQSFGARDGLLPEEATPLEDKIISAYLELVIKLNETAFSPLFRKSCDWAFGEYSSIERKITFCRIYSALLDLFKEFMTPYMSLLTSNFVDLLGSFQKKDNVDKELWLATVDTLSKSFTADDGAYWRDEKLRHVTGPLTQQISVCVELKIGAGKALLSACLSALVDCLEDDSSVKAVNLAVLMQTRSEDPRIRLFSLSCAVAMWQAHGAKLRGFGQETATFIMECAEDENDDVVKECRQLKDAVEAEIGKIDGL
ncbi:hypothetical protein EW145_g6726 [Phellinidium pouzarii]|uniref:U3 small nucleolar RNA-associated protein 10 n=1 Tax=Phellinidium pouzarii TaxID=167371 RepID=A0A4S4KZS3_9AGAM|nr:hypothetical protein EW145_g6726 [Phellinidium pouzarii]